MAYRQYKIQDRQGKPVCVKLKRDKRLKKTSRWERMPDGSLLLRIPFRLPGYRIGSLLEQVASQLDKSSASRKRRNNVDLQLRAEMVNRKYFNGKIQWNAIRWVGNMRTRLGSCTRGGPTDGEIRISDRIRSWPDWVIDYVIAHELMHRRHPNHSVLFWDELRTAYPKADQARGFIRGIGFAAGQALDEDSPETWDIS